MMKKYLSDKEEDLIKMGKKKLVSDQFYAIAKRIARRHNCTISKNGVTPGANIEADVEERVIYARDISVSSFLQIEKAAHNGKSFESIMKIIKQNTEADLFEIYEFDAIFVTFCILHECGHILDSTNQNLYSKESQNDCEKKKGALKIMYGPESSSFYDSYHKLPQEKSADDFAINKLAEELSCVTK